MPEGIDTVRAAARRLLDLLADGKHVVVVAPISKLSLRAMRDVFDVAIATEHQKDITAHFATREIRSATGCAEFYAERDIEFTTCMKWLHYDAAWAPFGMMLDTRDLVNAAMKPRNGAWL